MPDTFVAHPPPPPPLFTRPLTSRCAVGVRQQFWRERCNSQVPHAPCATDNRDAVRDRQTAPTRVSPRSPLRDRRMSSARLLPDLSGLVIEDEWREQRTGAAPSVPARPGKREREAEREDEGEGSWAAPPAHTQQQQQLQQQDTLQAEPLQHLPQLVAMVMSSQEAAQIEAVTAVRKLLSNVSNPPIQQVIDSNVGPRLVEFLQKSQSPLLQFESAWALASIASGTSRHKQAVIEMGAIPVFVALLKSQNNSVKEQAVCALGNIAGDSAQCRDRVLEAGALAPLLLALCTPDANITMLRNATWFLSNLCRGKPQPDFALVQPALVVLARLLYVDDDEVLTDACWALSFMIDDAGPQTNQTIQAVIEAGVARRLIEPLAHHSPNVKTAALRAVGNLATGDEVQTQVILNCSALSCLLPLLVNPKKSIRKEACWTISNITAGTPEQIELVILANIFPPLVFILRNEEFDIQKEAAWAISNAISGGTDAQIRYLAGQVGVVQPLCELFVCPDSKIIMVALKGVENILRVGKLDAEDHPKGVNSFADLVEGCPGLDLLEALQQHVNWDISKKATSILVTYFVSGEEEEDDLEMNDDASLFQFGAPQGGGGFSFGR